MNTREGATCAGFVNPYATDAVLERAHSGLAQAVEELLGRARSRDRLADFAIVVESCREPYRTAELYRLYERRRAFHFDDGALREIL